ncbi:MAG: NAD-dependent epimerase/dehydratase family protein [Cyanobacteriota bacterium]|nr:NAD-dependent epimerase/dehydratase family protein [Cyanobacteriota bacterium]
MQSSALIIGVSGFLGGYIAKEFMRQNYAVSGVDASGKRHSVCVDLVRHEHLSIPGEAFHALLRDLNPKVVINAAGSSSVARSISNPSLDYQANTALVFELLEAIRLHAPGCSFITLSSAAVYGNPTRLPIKENLNLRPLSPYGFHKLQAEILCQEYSSIHGIHTASARIFSAYGQGLRRQVIWDIARKCSIYGTVELMGTGEETRDFLHARDVAVAIRLLAERSDFKGEAYNIASGTEVSIRDLASLLIQAFGGEEPATFNGRQDPGTPKNWRADIQKLTALGFSPSISLEEGVRDVHDWFQSEFQREFQGELTA